MIIYKFGNCVFYCYCVGYESRYTNAGVKKTIEIKILKIMINVKVFLFIVCAMKYVFTVIS